MVSCRSILVLIFIAVFVSAAGTAEENSVPLLENSRPLVHAETQDDAFVPVPPGGLKTSPAYRSLSTGFFTTQVNVDFLGDNILGDAANEPSIAVDPTDHELMAIGWRQFDTVNSNFRQAGYGYTTDGGESWTFPGVIEPGVFRSDPVLDSDSEGTFYYNSLTVLGDEYHCDVFMSTHGGIFWDFGTPAHGGDKQWMVIDKTGGVGDGNIYAFWTSAYSSCLPGFFTRSVDGGLSYEDCIAIPDEPYWGTMAVGPDGELYVGGAGADFVVVKSSNAYDPGQAVSWEYSTPVDLDGTIGFGGGPNPGGLLGQTWIAVDRSENYTYGNVYLLCSVERNSNPDPLDVMFTRSTDGGLTWSEALRINDDAGTDAYQWFGTMSVAPTGRIDVIWLDTRNDPGGYESELYYSFSNDGGLSWLPNRRLTEAFDPHLGWPQQQKMGDYFDMVSDERGADLAYAATFNGEQDVYYARISADIIVPDDYSTIQEAIDAALDGNTIVLQPGTYAESGIDFHGKAVRLRSTDPDDPAIVQATVVDGDSLGGVFLFQSGEDTTSVIDGITITGGLSAQGGGISCSGSSPMITRNRIIGNAAEGEGSEGIGGGVSCVDASPVISGNTFFGNSAGSGGGVACSGSSSPELSGNVFAENSSAYGGGAAFWGGNPSLINNSFTENTADYGGGIHLGLCAHATVTNTILWANEASFGEQISVGGDSCEAVLIIRYSDAEGGEQSVWIAPDSELDWGEGMIEQDPLFRDPPAIDFHLMAIACGDTADSPCIDTGDPSLEDLVLDCESGLGTARSDMGAFGGGDEGGTKIGDDRSGSGSPVLPRTISMQQNYPNPFNPTTTITYTVGGRNGDPRLVTLVVHDLRGRRVRILVDEPLEPGEHRAVWDGRGERGQPLSSGVYLYTLRCDGKTTTRKMVLLK